MSNSAQTLRAKIASKSAALKNPDPTVREAATKEIAQLKKSLAALEKKGEFTRVRNTPTRMVPVEEVRFNESAGRSIDE